MRCKNTYENPILSFLFFQLEEGNFPFSFSFPVSFLPWKVLSPCSSWKVFTRIDIECNQEVKCFPQRNSFKAQEEPQNNGHVNRKARKEGRIGQEGNKQEGSWSLPPINSTNNRIGVSRVHFIRHHLFQETHSSSGGLVGRKEAITPELTRTKQRRHQKTANPETRRASESASDGSMFLTHWYLLAVLLGLRLGLVEGSHHWGVSCFLFYFWNECIIVK